ncbi:MAG: DNA-directed RNA polymerase subunit beta [Patescibacteria group bacterium]
MPVTRTTLGTHRDHFEVPDLNAIQIESYKNFWTYELPSILKDFSPITDSLGERWHIELGPEYYLEPDPNFTERDALDKGITYDAPFYLKVSVKNLVTNETKSQRIFCGRIPLITRNGNFIINGTQKIVVGQLNKSPGVLFMNKEVRGSYFYNARIIPTRGIWVDMNIAANNAIYVKIDRRKNFLATQLLRLFGITDNDEIMEIFKDVETDPNINYIQATLDRDNTLTVDDAVDNIYKKMRPGDVVSVEQGRKYLLNLFSDPTKYDMGEVGRFKFDQRLAYTSTPEEGNNYKKTLDRDELIAVIKELVRMSHENAMPDSMDSLANRRVRLVGEWMSNSFRAGLARVVRNSRDKMSLSDDVNFKPSELLNMRPLTVVIEDFFNTSQLARFMDQTNCLSELDERRFFTAGGPGGLTKERAGFEVRDVHPSHYGRLCPVNTPEGASFGINTHMSIFAKINRMGFLETPYLKVKKSIPVESDELIGRIALNEIQDKKKKTIVKAGQFITHDLLKQLRDEIPGSEIQVRPFISTETVSLDAMEELNYTIAQSTNDIDDQGHFTTDFIGARKSGLPVQVSVDQVDLVDVSASQILSLSSTMIPFIANTESFRALVGTNQQRQALPLVRPEAPKVATGFESVVARDSGYLVRSEIDGTVIRASGDAVVVIDSKGNEVKHRLVKYTPSNSASNINQKPVVSVGDEVKTGDILAEGFGIHDGEFAVGQNVLVAFLPFKGYNFDDAIVLSQRLVQQDKFSSIHIHDLSINVKETPLGDEVITRDIPNVGAEKMRNLDENGVIRIGAMAKPGDILVGKVTPKGEVELSPEDKLIRVLFGEISKDVKDSSLYLEHGLRGKVIAVKVQSRAEGHALPSDVKQRVTIWLAETRKIKPGDKMAGRHGNKGVVSVTLPVEDMPHMADGRPIDVVLNPLSVLARMNPGQLLEMHLGMACEMNGYHAMTQPLNEIPESVIKAELEQAGIPGDGKVDLWDGQTGEKFDRKVAVGVMYLNKLHHMVDDKMHARSTGPYSLVTQQPLGGRAQMGGQRFGEMEVWALEAYGAAYTLQEVLTIKSDDTHGREEAYASIIKNKPLLHPNIPESFRVLANELTALGIKVNADVIKSDVRYGDKRLDEKLALTVDTGSLK